MYKNIILIKKKFNQNSSNYFLLLLNFYLGLLLFIICLVVCLEVVLVVTTEVGLRALKFVFFLPEVNWFLHIINAIKHNSTNIE